MGRKVRSLPATQHRVLDGCVAVWNGCRQGMADALAALRVLRTCAAHRQHHRCDQRGHLGLWFRHVGRYERQPVKLVLTGFVWGATAATFASAVQANDALGSLYAKWFGQVWSQDWHAGLSAPFVEETAKGVGIVVLTVLAPRLVRTPTDGLLLGAFIGLGFQTSEDLLYSISGATQGFGSHQTFVLVGSIATRTFSDIVSHPLFTALFCAGSSIYWAVQVNPGESGAA